jgi:hypothetical protein
MSPMLAFRSDRTRGFLAAIALAAALASWPAPARAAVDYRLHWENVGAAPVQGGPIAYYPKLGKSIVYGGSTTYTWDGSAWGTVHTRHSPPSRGLSVMTYDPATRDIILFGGDGGEGSQDFNDTWIFDGEDWTQVFPRTSPPPRYGASMVFDAARNDVVLFGGFSGAFLNDTWVWNGVDWTDVSTNLGPSPRYEAAMAYYARSGTVVLFGGYAWGGPYSDTWIWNGSVWRRVTHIRSPEARGFAEMVFDRAIHRVVLFGGRSLDANLGDTWKWDGNDWTLSDVGPAPDPRYDFGMTYDAARREAVLVGGCEDDHCFSDIWALRAI